MKIQAVSLMVGDVIQATRWGQTKTEIVTDVMESTYKARDYFRPTAPQSIYHLMGEVVFIRHRPDLLSIIDDVLTEDDLRL